MMKIQVQHGVVYYGQTYFIQLITASSNNLYCVYYIKEHTLGALVHSRKIANVRVKQIPCQSDE